ncbi:hypothetical protein KBT16_17780 [Nostoc sp. CCCryo 231-06]|nr:hypothetical protein [Nostoc sp. CCCryo 231-06]
MRYILKTESYDRRGARGKLYCIIAGSAVTTGIFQGTLNRAIFENHIIDKIILECIIFHAGLHPNENKLFLSSNSKEFGRREVIEIFRDNGIQYFNKTQNFLGWLQSQSN